VLKRSRRTDCEGPCQSAIERYVWDGDDLLKEIRYPGRNGISADSLEVNYGIIFRQDTIQIHENDPIVIDTVYSPYYGTVTYTNGGTIDRPVMLERRDYGRDTILFGMVPVVLHYNANGVVDEGTFVSGLSTSSIDLRADWPGGDVRVYGERRFHGVPRSWFGGAIDQMRDASGFLYKRNRYYDPATGRFTQEDPIGLAGGMNLYGFAGGDPMNFADPFGLYPLPCCVEIGAGVVGPRFREHAVQELHERAAAQAIEPAEDPLEYLGFVGAVRKVSAKGIVKATSKLNVAIRGTRQYAKDLFRSEAGDDALEVMRDRLTKRITGVRTQDGSVILRPKKGKDGLISNVEVINEQGTRVTIHVRP